MEWIVVLIIFASYWNQPPIVIEYPVATQLQCEQAVKSFRIGERQVAGFAYCKQR